MSGHSEKKAKKAASSANSINLILILVCTGIYLIMHLYQYFIKKNEDIFTKKDLFGFLFFSLMNYLVYNLLNSFRGSYLEGYLFDFLGLNCLIEVLVNFSKKFWYLYLIYPAYFLIKGGKSLFGYVSNIGKGDDTDAGEVGGPSKYKDSGHQTKQVKEKKQKVKYEKY